MNINKFLVSGITAAMIIGTSSANIAAKAWNPDNNEPAPEPKQELRKPHEGMKIHGTISKVEENCIYIRLTNSREIKVNLTADTKYYTFRNPAAKKDLVAGKFVGITPSSAEKITDDTKEITAIDISVRPPVIHGTVSAVQGGEISIKLEDGSVKKLVVNKDTKIFMNPQEPYQGKIEPGMRLYALVDSIGDVMDAKVIRLHQK